MVSIEDLILPVRGEWVAALLPSCNHVIARGPSTLLRINSATWQSIMLSPPSPSRDRHGIGRRDPIRNEHRI